MSVQSSYHEQIGAGIGALYQRERMAKPGRRLIVALHGHGGDALQFRPSQLPARVVRGLVEGGYDVISVACGQSWGNDQHVSRALAARTWARTTGGSDGTRIALLGYSMGGLGSFNVATRNAGIVNGIIAVAPVVDLAYMYGQAGFTASIDAAYGGSWPTNGAGRDPMTELAPTLAAIGTPLRLFYGGADNVVGVGKVPQFAAAVGPTAVATETASADDHTVLWNNVSVPSVLAFLDGLAWG